MPDLEEQVFYVSFLDGTQRVLLFTSNMKIAEDCQLSDDFEVIEQEVSINIHGIGLSLVNNITRSELLYMCIARYIININICDDLYFYNNLLSYFLLLLFFSSGIIWEIRKSINHRWRSLSTREVNLIEEGYQKYMRELQIGKDPMQKVILEPKLEVIEIIISFLIL